MRRVYTALMYLLLPFLALRLLLLGFRDRGYWRRLPERFGFVAPAARPCLWVHAVSVGEVQAAAPLIKRLLKEFAHFRVVLTTVTPTGAEMARARFGDAVQHCFLPFDLPPLLCRFIARQVPALLAIMETELWPNLIAVCHRHGIPVVLVNARLSRSSQRGYQRAPRLTAQMLDSLAWVAARGEQDAERFRTLGAPPERILVSGNVKFDVQPPSDLRRSVQPWRAALAERPAWIAASTHPGEDEIVLQAHLRVLTTRPDCLLVLVPRHPQRSAGVLALCASRGVRAAQSSHGAAGLGGIQVLVVDTLGELWTFYALVQVAFVGGSLRPVGGHNMLEPAALGLPVLTGPHTEIFADIHALLTEAAAARTVADAPALAAAVAELLDDHGLRTAMGAGARGIMDQNRGAVDRLLALFHALL